MRAAVLLCALVLLPVPSLLAQPAEPDHSNVEFVALTRPGFLLGAQAEYAGVDLVAPWVSVRYGAHYANCLDSSCGDKGVSTLVGGRLRTGSWGPIEPYATVGVGLLWGEDDHTAWEPTGTAHVGFVWSGLGRIRPRIEFGHEAQINSWMNVGIGFVP